MEKVEHIESQVIPLPRRNVDTDMIIPAEFLTSVSREGYGENLFKRLREQETDFPLNLEKYAGARVLLVDDNFGCGSSREHAVWALMGWGIRAIIGKSFADIFASNSGKNGLLLIPLEETLVDEILQSAENTDLSVEISLKDQHVAFSNGESASFDYDPFRKHCLLEGLDDIDYILSHRDEIDTYIDKEKPFRFFSSLKANHS